MHRVDQIVHDYANLRKQYQLQRHQLSAQKQLTKENQFHNFPTFTREETSPNKQIQSTPLNQSNLSSESNALSSKHSQFFMEQIIPLIKTSQTSLLYSLSHKLIQLFPDDEHAYFCIGSYYWCINKLELAQRFLRRAIKSNRNFADAWILLGHIYSTNEESEQALASYRTAIRLLPNHKLPLICLSKELLRNNNYWLAAHMLQSAIQLDPSDILILNEMSLIAVKMGNLPHAEQILRKAIASLQQEAQESSSTCEILYNYGTVLRKLGQYEDAIDWYQRCLKFAWHKIWALVALGFTLHLLRRFEEAATYYHQALAIQPNCVICSEMLNHLMEDMLLYEGIDPRKNSTESDRKEKKSINF